MIGYLNRADISKNWGHLSSFSSLTVILPFIFLHVVSSDSCSLDCTCLYIGLDKQKFQLKIVHIFLPIIINMCFWCSKEPLSWFF